MQKETINTMNKIEEFLYDVFNEKKAAAVAADLIGVIEEIKPAALVDSPKESMNRDEFIKKIKALELEVVFEIREYVNKSGEVIKHGNLFVSKKRILAEKLKEELEKMWSTLNSGKIIDRAKWKKSSLEIGKMLGYPETAVEYFVEHTNDDMVEIDDDWTERMNRNRYYAHSKEHEKEEFLAYDKPLNVAIEKYLPVTAEILRSDKNRRWKEY